MRINKIVCYYFLSAGLFFTLSCSQGEKKDIMTKNTVITKTQPPQAKKIPKTLELHGDKRVDNYFWMRDRDSKPVLDFLNAENQYFETHAKNWEKVRKNIFSEMKARVKEDDTSPPSKDGKFYFFTQYNKGKEYPLFMRSTDKQGKNAKVLLDVNKLAEGKKFTEVAEVESSPNEKTVAYAVDHVGRRFYDIYFKNLATGKLLKQHIKNTTGNFVWANDNKTIFYSQQNPETLRSEKVFKFNIETGLNTEIYFEKNEIFNVGVSKSLTDNFIFIESGSFDSSEIRFVNANKPDENFKLFLPRETKLEYSIEDSGSEFFIHTNWQAENFRIMKAPYAATNKNQWSELIRHKPETFISGMLVFKSYLVLREREKGSTQLHIYDRKTKISSFVNFPDPVYVVNFGSNHEFDTKKLRYSYQSLVRPSSVFDFNFSSQESVLIKQNEVPTYDYTKYESEKIWAKASDGTEIPVSIIYKKGFKKDGSQPLLLYGYGSYGYSMDPSFRISIFSLLDRGFAYAIAHVRGGSEMGRSWYEQGRMLNKKNTFTDFNSVAEHLIKNKYTASKKLYAMGGSAGGLLMGAIVNLKPDLYNGIVSAVPFVDVLTTMLDSSIPLTTGEFEQWGNPNEKKYYDYIKSYSPYDNIEKKDYPSMLVVTGYHDSQVQYWEPAKYVAKLRDYKTDDNLVFLKTDMDSGHGGASGRFKAIEEIAVQYAFLLNLEGIKE
jgi:oligopeptidase B